ncbi:MAG TPA: ABC transporter permease [Vicinamibacterales bacterium]|nr:ABC transporter permease [Vicinamibacterales bacterium]
MKTDKARVWGWGSLERLWQDLRYGCRMLAANPGFTLVAVSSLAMGIGANCAAFSWADALLLRPLTVARPGEVVTVGSRMSVEGFSRLGASYREYLDVRDRSSSFSGLVAFTGVTSGLAATPDALPKLTLGLLVSGNFFSVMGVEPELGRTFRPEEDRVPGRDAVVIVSHSLWEHQFGSDPSILGRRVQLSGIEFTIVGVAPERFTGMNQFVRSDFYAPLMMWPRLLGDPKERPLEDRNFRNITIKGRLQSGVSLARAQTELSVIAKDLERAYPDTNRDRALVVRTELQTRIAQSPPDSMLIGMLTTLAFAVLFVACANVAGLLTSRAPTRAREMAMRLAIGAGRARLIRQLMTESLLIALAGGVLGLAVGYGGIKLFQQVRIPTDLPVALTFQLDRRALVFSLVVAVLSAVLFGLAPAIQTSRADLTMVMKGGETMVGRRRRWGRNLLVGGQVAVSVVLLVLAAFMYRGFQQQLSSGPGYRTDHLLMMSFDPSLVHYTEDETRRFFLQLAERARSLPGVKSVALASSVPMANDGINVANVIPEGYQLPVGQENLSLFSARVDEHYFTTIGIPIVLGRGFREADSTDAPRVAVVNEQFAQHYWPNQDPIGKRFQLRERAASSWIAIVGVAKTTKYLWLGEPPTEFVYLPYRQNSQSEMVLLTQSAGDPSSLVAPLRNVVQALDRTQPIYNVRTMEEFYQMRTITIFKVIIGTIGAMGMMGLGLAIVGLYGLVAYATSRRTKEIGIRMAIGAGRTAVLRMVLRQGLVLAVAGLAAGLLAGVGAERGLQAAFPSGDNSFHPMAHLLVAPIVLAATFIAAYLPARRAARLDPMKALRYE